VCRQAAPQEACAAAVAAYDEEKHKNQHLFRDEVLPQPATKQGFSTIGASYGVWYLPCDALYMSWTEIANEHYELPNVNLPQKSTTDKTVQLWDSAKPLDIAVNYHSKDPAIW
jgi:hypothetical protein